MVVQVCGYSDFTFFCQPCKLKHNCGRPSPLAITPLWTRPNNSSWLTFATITNIIVIVINRMESRFSKLKLKFRRHQGHQKSEILKTSQHAKQEGEAAGPLNPSTSLTTDPKVSSNTPTSSPNLPEQLWNTAYDQLKQKEPKLVDAYETVLSQALTGHSLSCQPLQQNLIEQMHIPKRRYQMDKLIQIGLAKTEKEARVQQNVGEVMDKILSVKDVVSSAIEVMPQAALAWTGVCFALQVIL